MPRPNPRKSKTPATNGAASGDSDAPRPRLIIHIGYRSTAPPHTDNAPPTTAQKGKNKAEHNSTPENSKGKGKAKTTPRTNGEASRPRPRAAPTQDAVDADSGGEDEDDDEVEIVFIPPPSHDSTGRPLPSVESMDANFLRNMRRNRRDSHHASASPEQPAPELPVNAGSQTPETSEREKEERIRGLVNDFELRREEGGRRRRSRAAGTWPMPVEESAARELEGLSTRATHYGSDETETVVGDSSQTISRPSSNGSGEMHQSGQGDGDLVVHHDWEAEERIEGARDDRIDGAAILMGIRQNAGADDAAEIQRLEKRQEELEEEKRGLARILAGMAREEV